MGSMGWEVSHALLGCLIITASCWECITRSASAVTDSCCQLLLASPNSTNLLLWIRHWSSSFLIEAPALLVSLARYHSASFCIIHLILAQAAWKIMLLCTSRAQTVVCGVVSSLLPVTLHFLMQHQSSISSLIIPRHPPSSSLFIPCHPLSSLIIPHHPSSPPQLVLHHHQASASSGITPYYPSPLFALILAQASCWKIMLLNSSHSCWRCSILSPGSQWPSGWSLKLHWSRVGFLSVSKIWLVF